MAAGTEKKSLRRDLKAQRTALGADVRAAADAKIAQVLLESDVWAQADLVLTYVSFGDEVDTKHLIEAAWRQGKKVALPRMTGRPHEMEWYLTKSFQQLEQNSFGIEEPKPEKAQRLDIAALPQGALASGLFKGASAVALPQGVRALALVPALAFDREGNRLGYGGGFYDMFLREFSGVSVGLCRAAFLYEKLPYTEAHDQRVGSVLTETGWVF